VAPAPADATDQTSTWQIDPAHTGGLPNDPLTPPLQQRWSLDLRDPDADWRSNISNPLVVGSLVYFSAGRWLTVLDVHTGAPAWGPVAQGGWDSSAYLAYDQGQIFAANGDGIVRAYNARTGAPTWSIVLPREMRSLYPPTAYNGTLYLTGDNLLVALDTATGAVRWTADSGDSSPAVSGQTVYIYTGCYLAAFAAATGAKLWDQRVDCVPIGDDVAAVYRDRVYTAGQQGAVYMFDAARGQPIGVYQGSTLPAFAGTRGFVGYLGQLQAFDVATGATLWKFAPGDGDELTGAPIVVRNTVYIGSAGGTLYGVEAATGRKVVEFPDLGDRINVGLSAGSGVLVVPVGARLFAFTSATGGPPAPSPTPDWTQPRYFPETGHTLQGRFRQYWEEHGGLAQQGYPLTDEFSEVSALDGQTYTVQYFERAVFEWHPENASLYDVLLAQLGTYRYRELYPQGAPGQHRNANNPQDFAATGHAVGGSFRPYWETHGGLAQFGYPLSDEFAEESDLDGRTYMVQYFERAVFEWHPENAPPYDILLSQLGTYRLRQVYPQGPPAP
jgi:outer membrane protein assembly factor BamB